MLYPSGVFLFQAKSFLMLLNDVERPLSDHANAPSHALFVATYCESTRKDEKLLSAVGKEKALCSVGPQAVM